MKIIELRAENLKRLTAVCIKPTGELVEIAGSNGAGKTSVLDAIWWALGGERNVQAEPIRRGEQEASVVLDLGELKVTRTWRTGKGSLLKVENAEGMAATSPQAMLDKLVGQLTFDPLSFTRMKPKEQRELLLHLSGLGADLEKFAAERKRLYDERTAFNRLAAQLKAILASEGVILVQGEEVSLTKLAEEISAAERSVCDNQELRDVLEQHKFQRNSLQEQIDALQAKIKLMDAQIAKESEMVASLVDPDVSALQKRLGAAEANNALVRARNEQHAKRRALNAAVGQSERISEQLADIDIRKQHAMSAAAAALPIAELGFSDSGVLYRDLPFDQCSAAEQLRVSVAIGMALNPKLRVLRITDGSLLDAGNLALLETMAREHDFQVWIERVEPGRAGAVVIEEGHVRIT